QIRLPRRPRRPGELPRAGRQGRPPEERRHAGRRSGGAAVTPERAREMGRRVRRGAYLLPSLFTMGNVLLGFYAIVLGLRSTGIVSRDPALGEPLAGFKWAAIMIFIAALIDGVDGRIARLTGTESDFGKEY